MSATNSHRHSELHRLVFIAQRDGLHAAVDFARRTLKLYRTCLRLRGHNGTKRHHATLPQYRRGFVESCLVFRSNLKGWKK